MNERVQNAEAEAELQAQATQTELVRQQAGAKGKENSAAVSLRQAQGVGAFASKYQPQPFKKASTRSGANGLEFFAVGLDDFFGGSLAEIYEYIKRHRNDSATLLDLALTSLRFDAGLLRNISTELYHVLIMVTRGGALRVGAQGGRARETGSVSTSPPTI